MKPFNKHITLLLTLLGVFIFSFGYTQTLDHQTISSGGIMLKNNTAGLNITTGQAIIGVGSAVNLKFTQGFNQPDCDLNLDIGPIPKVCENGALVQLYASIPGGVFSGPGIIGNTLHPEVAGAGNHQLAYHIDLNGCKDSAFVNYTIKPKPQVNFVINDTVCRSGIYLLNQGAPSGGIYTGLGVQVNGANYVFRPQLAGVGNHPIQYTYTDTNGCSASDTANYSVIKNPTVSLSLANNLVCPNTDSLILSGGSPAGGFFTGNGINTQTSTFYPDSAAYGFQLVTYNYLDTNNGCSGTAYATLLNDTLPNNLNLSFTNDVCTNQQPSFLNAAQPNGGQYFGVNLNITPGGYFNPQLVASNTYQVGYAYTTSLGCTDTVYDQLTVHAPQKPILNNIPLICSSDSITNLSSATPSGGVYSGLNITNNQLNPAGFSVGAFNYYYEIIDANNCVGRDTAIINVVTPAPLNLSLSGYICENEEPINLNSYNSFGSGQYLGTGIQDTLFVPSVVGAGNTVKIHAFGVDSNNCTASDSSIITIATPTPVSFSMAGVCNNTTKVKLKGGLPQGGLYSGPFVDSIGYFYPSQAKTNTNLFYTFTNLFGCQTVDTFNLQLFQVQKPQITEVPAICKNDSALALAANISGGKFSGNGVSQGFLHPNQVSVSTSNYFYAITDANGCPSRDTSVINILEPPTINQNMRQNICEGSKAEYFLPEEQIYLWSDGYLGPNHQLAPTTTTNYAITVSDGFCASSDTFTVQVYPKPNFTVSRQEPNCEMENGKIFVTASGPTGPYQYNWSSGHFGTSVATNLNAGIYELSVTDVYGCVSVETYALSNLNAPTISNSNINSPSCFNDDNASIGLTLNNPALYNYKWMRGDTGLSINNLGAGSYFFTLEEISSGCISVNEFRIENPAPISIIPQITPNSCGNNLGRIFLAPSGGSGGYSFNWNTSETTDIIQNKPSGLYTVTVTDGNNCTSTNQYFIPNKEKLYVQLDTLIPPDCGLNNGGIAVKSLGPNYTVVWGANDTTYALQNLSGGVYNVDIYGVGCSTSLPLTLNNLKPTQPSICKVSIDTGYGEAIVAWEGNGDKQYLYRRGIEQGAYQLIYTDSSTTKTQITDNYYINSNVPLTYQVVSENQCGDLSYDDDYLSSIFLSAIRVDGDKVRLKWTEEIQDPSSVSLYTLYGKQEPNQFILIANINPPTTFYELDSLGTYSAFFVAAEVSFCANVDTMYSNITTRISFDPNLFRNEVVVSEPLRVYPNPARSSTNILFQNTPKGEIDVTLFGANGQVVLKTTYNPTPGQTIFELPLTKIAVGSYSLRIGYDNKVENMPLLIN